jgi:hypothetical protein
MASAVWAPYTIIVTAAALISSGGNMEGRGMTAI